ncbi:MAG: PepSY domain-containing protein [Limisphaerales bacterium]
MHSELPAAVTKAINDRFPGATLISAERETEKGRVYYEVEIRDKEGRWEVDVTPEGKIIDIDRET